MKSLSKEINDADFVHLAADCVGHGLLETGKRNYELAQQLAKQEAIEFFKWNAASIKGYVDYIMRERDGDVDLEEALSKFENSTIEQRYELYLQHKQKTIIP